MTLKGLIPATYLIFSRCPIYCTKFTAAVLRAKFDDFPNCKGAKIIEFESGQTLSLDPFKLQFLNVSHSIPQAVSTAIETKYGTVVHSGDWNRDPTPVIGRPTDEEAFKSVGERGVLAYIGDSTNCLVPGRGGSETTVQAGLEQLFSEIKGRVAITIFASNVGRIHSISLAAKKAGRKVCLLGRSLHRMVASARSCGMLRDVPEFVAVEDLDMLSPDRVPYIVTGSQGEALAALPRIARGEWPHDDRQTLQFVLLVETELESAAVAQLLADDNQIEAVRAVGEQGFGIRPISAIDDIAGQTGALDLLPKSRAIDAGAIDQEDLQ